MMTMTMMISEFGLHNDRSVGSREAVDVNRRQFNIATCKHSRQKMYLHTASELASSFLIALQCRQGHLVPFTESLHFKGHFPGGPGLAGTRMSPFWVLLKQDDGGGDYNWSYKMCKDPAKLSPSTNQHPVFYRPDALPVTQPTVSQH